MHTSWALMGTVWIPSTLWLLAVCMFCFVTFTSCALSLQALCSLYLELLGCSCGDGEAWHAHGEQHGGAAASSSWMWQAAGCQSAGVHSEPGRWENTPPIPPSPAVTHTCHSLWSLILVLFPGRGPTVESVPAQGYPGHGNSQVGFLRSGTLSLISFHLWIYSYTFTSILQPRAPPNNCRPSVQESSSSCEFLQRTPTSLLPPKPLIHRPPPTPHDCLKYFTRTLWNIL